MKSIYFFDEGDGKNRKLLGGKGAGLCEMTRLKLPVPPGFVITTEVCKNYYENNKTLSKNLISEVKKNIAKIEKKTGKKWNSKEDPLLVSVRSGASISMPGMMDTILNLGLNEETVLGLAKKSNNPRFAWDSYRRFIQLFGKVVFGVNDQKFDEVLDHAKKNQAVQADSALNEKALKQVVFEYKKICEKHTGRLFPSDPFEQLELAIKAVFDSWMGERAIVYRKKNNIEPQDIEFTVEQGKFYLLQTRSAKMNAAGMVKTSVDMTKEKLITQDRALLRLNADQLEQLLHNTIDPNAKGYARFTKGITASPGAASGVAIFDVKRAVEKGDSGTSVILVREETKPEDVPAFFSSVGILTSRGGKTSHAAVVARGMGKACIVGCNELKIDYEARKCQANERVISEGDVITIDGSTGTVFLGAVPTIKPEITEDFKTILNWSQKKKLEFVETQIL